MNADQRKVDVDHLFGVWANQKMEEINTPFGFEKLAAVLLRAAIDKRRFPHD